METNTATLVGPPADILWACRALDLYKVEDAVHRFETRNVALLAAETGISGADCARVLDFIDNSYLPPEVDLDEWEALED